MHREPPQREVSSREAAALVHAEGREAVSPTILLPCMRRAVTRNGGVAGFVDVAGARVFAGSPVAPPGAGAERSYPASGRIVVFGRELEDSEAVPAGAYVVGEQPWWELAAWQETVRVSRSLRAQIRRAANKGVWAREPSPSELTEGSRLRATIDGLLCRWMRSRHLEPLSFVAAVDPFFCISRRRCFVAEAFAAEGEAELLGVLFAVPIGSSGSWLLDHIVRTRGAPNGTAELLVDAALRALAAAGAQRATLGLCPLAGRVPWPLALVFRASRGLFDFRGLYAFKAKLKPQRWQRVLLEHPGQTGFWATVRALRAFAGGSLVLFGIRSGLRGPPPLLRLVAVLLVPWSCALAQPAARRFFPENWMPWSWVAFDLAVSAGLLWLARRISRSHHRRWLHYLLAVAISVDAVLTLTQALLWNASRVRSLADGVIIVVACLAPWSVATVLWSALRFRQSTS
jgi:phosphatidylglycerol lysyltransferase